MSRYRCCRTIRRCAPCGRSRPSRARQHQRGGEGADDFAFGGQPSAENAGGILADAVDRKAGAPSGAARRGREYYRSIRSAFNVLRRATEHVREQSASRQVTISLIPLFGMGWFIPRLRGFLRENPDIDINVVYANHRNYLSDAADLSIRFGVGQWTGYRSEKLMSGQMVPVCSRAFSKLHGLLDTPDQLATLPLLHDEERNTGCNGFSWPALNARCAASDRCSKTGC